MDFRYRLNEQEVAFILDQDSDSFIVLVGGETYSAELIHSDQNEITFQFRGKIITAYVARDGESRWVSIAGRAYQLERVSPDSRERRAASHAGADTLIAAMPGQVRAVFVSAGEQVARGRTIILLEAMKMEMRISAPQDGTVLNVPVSEGDVVERGQLLIELEA